MKGLTIYQPSANHIADGKKRYETRSWFTTYRGPLAIHASKSRSHSAVGPFGAIVAVGRLAACYRTRYLTEWCEDEIADEIEIGDFSPGRVGWLIKDGSETGYPYSNARLSKAVECAAGRGHDSRRWCAEGLGP